MHVQMKQHFTGYRDGEEWPPVGGIIEISDTQGADLVAAGYAVEVDPDAVGPLDAVEAPDATETTERDGDAAADGDSAAVAASDPFAVNEPRSSLE